VREDAKIDQRIAAILVGSGLSLERRAEVAEELRGHLEQLVASQRQAGLPDAQAVEAALTRFGSPQVIRKQLRRQQRMLDRREALAAIRRPTWGIGLLAVVTGLYAAAIAVLHPQPSSPLMRCLWGVVLFAWFLVILIVPVYWAALFACRIERRQPREEYHVRKSLLRGMGMGVVFLAYALAWAPLWVMPVTPLLFEAPEFAHYLPGAFWHAWWVAVLESAGWVFGLLAVGVSGFGLGVVLHERSRCVTDRVIPAEG
jgi:hypothetical protein